MRTGFGLCAAGRSVEANDDDIRKIECVSRRHALIVLSGNEAALDDLASKNGTHLNGRRIKGREVLEHGDQILLGDHTTVLRFAESNSKDTPSEPTNLQVSTSP